VPDEDGIELRNDDGAVAVGFIDPSKLPGGGAKKSWINCCTGARDDRGAEKAR